MGAHHEKGYRLTYQNLIANQTKFSLYALWPGIRRYDRYILRHHQAELLPKLLAISTAVSKNERPGGRSSGHRNG